ncbi:MAG: ABC transporter permease [Huintestinicola sp.]
MMKWYGDKMNNVLGNSSGKIKKFSFLFEELVKRDFKKKYKRTVLGMLWSILSPLFMLTVLALVFTNLFGRNIDHFIIYLFCGELVFNYFSDSTTQGMSSLLSNKAIFTKINVPKYLFLLSKNVACLINFLLTFVVFWIFVAFEGIPFSWKFFLLIFPIACLIIFNLGIGMILSALFIFFRDIQYLYDIFKMALMYFSAIFYDTSSFSDNIAWVFNLNPVYVYITYFRDIVLYNRIPSMEYHLLCMGYALASILIGALIYKKNNYKFLYYV